ncbi:MAG: RluA family pseudouridine synthase [Oscillospiraceae bacterium]|nr:RluA family pseudouridine synthase [Oscillospiraceae bacterium]
MKEFIINKNDSGQRLDKFIIKAVPKLPKSLLYKYVRLKRIKLNGKRCEISQMLCAGDVLNLYINDEFFENNESKAVNNLTKTKSTPDIVYEDENIIIVYKPVGMDVHHGAEKPDETLIDIIQAYLYSKKEYNPDEENSFAPAICNRIDRNTTGLVIAAKNSASLREINENIRLRKIEKEYLCICSGKLPKKHSVEQAYHCKGKHNSVHISDKPLPEHKKIITEYTVLEEKNGFMLVKINLITGKTHQIRAHMSFLGAPLLGDGKYGNVKTNKQNQVFTQQLCAYSLKFNFEKNSPLEYLNSKKIISPKTGFKINLFNK